MARAKRTEQATIGGALQGELTPHDDAIMLPSSLDLLSAEPLRSSLVEALARAAAITLSGSEVERASTPCLQVLLAAGRAADKSGTAFLIRDPSATLSGAMADLGLAEEFEKWIV